jgi:hypothetical protein
MTHEELSADQIFERLAAPFDGTEVRERRGSHGRVLRYITARTARRRLNQVLGFDGWECKVRPADEGVVCSLTIHLPDGRSLTREAMGGYRQTNEEQDRSKSADSDAFKRACVLFRVAEYLYGEEDDERQAPSQARREDRDRRPEPRQPNGQPRGQWGNAYRGEPRQQQQPPARQQPQSEPRDGGQPRTGKAFWAWLAEREETHPEGAGIKAHVLEWAADQGYPDRCFRWSFDQIKAAHAEGVRFLSSQPGAYQSVR